MTNVELHSNTNMSFFILNMNITKFWKMYTHMCCKS